MNTNKEMMVYEAPQVEVIEVEVEKGFAVSVDPNNFEYGGSLSGNN
ncbi:MAG: hypothetical protein IKU64_06945 [Bacteroides sp.]|nr:hypothetical protein [Bacteroides sp.]